MKKQIDNERDGKRDYSAYNFKFYLEFAVVSFLCCILGNALGFLLSRLFLS